MYTTSSLYVQDDPDGRPQDLADVVAQGIEAIERQRGGICYISLSLYLSLYIYIYITCTTIHMIILIVIIISTQIL